MTYLIGREGEIQTSQIEFEMTQDMIRKAVSSGLTRIDGVVQVICEELGLEVEDIEEVAVFGTKVKLKSKWARPSRR